MKRQARIVLAAAAAAVILLAGAGAWWVLATDSTKETVVDTGAIGEEGPATPPPVPRATAQVAERFATAWWTYDHGYDQQAMARAMRATSSAALARQLLDAPRQEGQVTRPWGDEQGSVRDVELVGQPSPDDEPRRVLVTGWWLDDPLQATLLISRGTPPRVVAIEGVS